MWRPIFLTEFIILLALCFTFWCCYIYGTAHPDEQTPVIIGGTTVIFILADILLLFLTTIIFIWS